MRYIALLRAVNVGGRTISMDKLRAAFESLGFKDVQTYIQTGNVIFGSDEADRKKLANKIEEKLGTAVFLLTADELKDAVANNPFEPEKHEQERRCHLMFMSQPPEADRVAKLMAIQKPEYSFHIHGQVFYYAYSKEFDGPKRRQINFEKSLGVSGTARTWKVVNKLIELAS